jgi:DNA-3-methyladenine glycosylase II
MAPFVCLAVPLADPQCHLAHHHPLGRLTHRRVHEPRPGHPAGVIDQLGRVPDAAELAAVDQETLRGLGLSRRKAATVLDLAQRFSDGRLSEAELRELPDQDVIGQLTAVKGIGAWTVQGALLIALRRPDVVRPDDLALRHAVRARYGLDHLPDPAEVADLAQRWRPYRSLASSLLLATARPG